MGAGVEWFESAIDISAYLGIGSATVVDVSGDGVPASATFVILAVIGGDATTNDIRFWKPGATWGGGDPNLNKDSLSYPLVAVVNSRFYCYRSHISIKAHLLGYGKGGNWFDTYHDVDPPATGSWQDIDITAQDPNAVLAVLALFDPTGWGEGLRPNDDTLNKLGTVYPHGWGYIGCDASQKYETYHGHAVIIHRLYGTFSSGEGLTVRSNLVPLTFSAMGAWVEVDASAFVGAGHKAALLQVFTEFTAHKFGVRKVGGTTTWLGFGQQMDHAVVELDANGHFEAYLEELTPGASGMYVVASLPSLANPRSQGYVIG